MTVTTHINPDGMHVSPALTQAVRVAAGADMVYVGGQNGVDASGRVVAADLAGQARQAFVNVQTCLAAAGADLADVVKWTILVCAGEPVAEGFQAFLEVWGQRPHPPGRPPAHDRRLRRLRCRIPAPGSPQLEIMRWPLRVALRRP